MLRKIVFVPFSGVLGAAAYGAWKLSNVPGCPQKEREQLQFASFCLGTASAGSAYIGLKPGKKKHCKNCGHQR